VSLFRCSAFDVEELVRFVVEGDLDELLSNSGVRTRYREWPDIFRIDGDRGQVVEVG
jgi:hypothetical protein